MRPTRRGYAVAAVVAAAVAVGAAFGARSLDAVVLPGVVALVAAAVQVWRAPAPGVERALPPADEPGTTGTVELRLDAPRTYPATIRDRLPAGVAVAGSGVDGENADAGESNEASEAVVDAAIGGTVSYEIARRRRGRHDIGPLAVVVTDVLGLFERTIALDVREDLLVFPRVRRLSGSAEANLRALTRSQRATRRDEFDDLREYVRGDALRDVHWKSSAKRGELMIREFTAETDPDRVTVAAGVAGAERPRGEAEDGDETDPSADPLADAMAEAAATVCLALIREGASVRLSTPAGGVDAGVDDTRAMLDHLAVVDRGPVPALDGEPDVAVVVDDERTVVRFDGRGHRFESMIGEADGEGRPDGRSAVGADVAADADGAGPDASSRAGRVAPASGSRRGGGSSG
ncbi:DUF58 domain-containing protein [Halobellus sp. EA9]|uniref:DUF58 domain-containing protein n=1 Tax=Halobellus sp. EA9 TaxID=3421647 RepID=UPI003EC0CE50